MNQLEINDPSGVLRATRVFSFMPHERLHGSPENTGPRRRTHNGAGATGVFGESLALAGCYERSLWFPTLRYAFPGLQRRGIRRDAHEAMRSLHLLRNRIAHHEPIHNRPLAKLHDQALTTAGWVCPVTRQWIAARSRVPELLAAPLETTPGR